MYTRKHEYIHTYTHTYTHKHTHIHLHLKNTESSHKIHGSAHTHVRITMSKHVPTFTGRKNTKILIIAPIYRAPTDEISTAISHILH